MFVKDVITMKNKDYKYVYLNQKARARETRAHALIEKIITLSNK